MLFFYAAYIDDAFDSLKRSPYIIIQSLFYSHLLNYITIKAWLDYKLGRVQDGKKVARTGQITFKDNKA